MPHCITMLCIIAYQQRERERESKSYVDGGNAVSSKKELVSQLVIHPLYVLCGVEKSTLSESTLVLPRLFPNLD
jgi:hypothetical protein